MARLDSHRFYQAILANAKLEANEALDACLTGQRRVNQCPLGKQALFELGIS